MKVKMHQFEFCKTIFEQYNAYHNHKENQAWGATVLFLGFVFAISFSEINVVVKWLPSETSGRLFFLIVFVGFVALFLWLILRQTKHRRIARIYVMCAKELMSQSVCGKEFDTGEPVRVEWDRGDARLMPSWFVQQYSEVSTDLKQWSSTEKILLAANVFGALVLGWKIYLLYAYLTPVPCS